jgi:DNA processing protein
MDLATVNAKLGLLAASGFIERAPSGWRLTKSGKSPR